MKKSNSISMVPIVHYADLLEEIKLTGNLEQSEGGRFVESSKFPPVCARSVQTVQPMGTSKV